MSGRRRDVIAWLRSRSNLEVAALLLLAACATSPDTSTARQALDPDVAWTRHTIHDGLLGADGVELADLDGDGDLDAVAAWEESARVTVSLCPADPTAPWPTAILYTHPGAEDVALADVDGDGRVDVVSAGEDKKIRVAFAPAPADLLTPAAWEVDVIAAATNLQQWLVLAPADYDGDGAVDLAAGGRVAYPPRIVVLESGTDPRDAAGWSLTPVGNTGWTMSLLPRDVDGDGDPDLLVSDRTYFAEVSGGPRTYDLMGTRWLRNDGASWVNQPVSSPPTGRTARMLGDGGSYLVDGYSDGMPAGVTASARAGWMAWGAVAIPWPANAGTYQSATVTDVDLDGLLDLVVTCAAADGDLSGVVWLRAPNWERHEVSGPAGTKFDDARMVDVDRDGDLDVVTTEQQDGLGVVWYERP